MEKSAFDSQMSKIAKEVIGEFRKQLKSSTERLEEISKKLNILKIDANAIPLEEGYSEFSKIKEEYVETSAMPFKTLYGSLLQYLGVEKTDEFVKELLEENLSDLTFSGFDLKKEVSKYLSLDRKGGAK